MASGFQVFLAHCSPQQGGDKFCSINATLRLNRLHLTMNLPQLSLNINHFDSSPPPQKLWLSELQPAPEAEGSHNILD